MIPDPHLAELPVDAIGEIRAWLEHRSRGLPAPLGKAGGDPVPVTRVLELPVGEGLADCAIHERFLNEDASGGVFGIVTEPVNRADWNGQYVVLLNSGSIHHVGPNRMYVTIARRLAAEGSSVCRADLRGLGDSPTRADSRENDPYPAGAIDDIAQILAALQSESEASCIALVGICSGAWASFHAALTLSGITDVVLINADFYGERSVVGKPSSFVRPKDYSHYKHAARSLAKWQKLLLGRADIRKIVRVLWNQAALAIASWKTKLAGGQHQLDQDLARLAMSGVRVGFLVSPGDGAQDFLAMHGRRGRDRLRREGLFREFTVDGSDHTFSPPDAQVRVGDTLSEWLRR